MKSSTLLWVGAAVAAYFLFFSGSSASGQTTAGNATRAALDAFLPNDTVFTGLVNSLSDAQATALLNWNNAGRPNTWSTDPVLAPVITAFKNAGNYFF
jgi:hypothetical protein